MLTFSLAGHTGEIQLTPAGPVFRADDGSGRPADAPAWRIDRSIAQRLRERLSARTNPLVIDYDHQTLLAQKNGRLAPAAGWFKNVEWREGEGLFATDVQWTTSAAAMIAAGEYRFISPVFDYQPGSGVLMNIRMAALTNDPGLDGMKAVALSAALARSEDRVQKTEDGRQKTDELPGAARPHTVLSSVLCPLSSEFDPQPKGAEMELKTLLAALALPDDKTEAEALAALAALKAEAESVEAKYAELAAKKAEADPGAALIKAEYERASARLTALEKEREDERVAAAVCAALSARKIAPANKEWAEAYCRKDPDGFAQFVEHAVPLLDDGKTAALIRKPAAADADATHPLLKDALLRGQRTEDR
jgi:phage I-like protein